MVNIKVHCLMLSKWNRRVLFVTFIFDIWVQSVYTGYLPILNIKYMYFVFYLWHSITQNFLGNKHYTDYIIMHVSSTIAKTYILKIFNSNDGCNILFYFWAEQYFTGVKQNMNNKHDIMCFDFY